MIYRLSSLFKLDSKGKIREWFCEIDEDKYRTIAGVKDGKMVTSGWTIAKGKNIGRANETTSEEQALSQVESKYTKQRDSSYHDDIANVGKTEFFSPMLATKWEDLKDKITYPIYVQPKLDGVRCIITCDGAKTRNGKDIPTIPHILEELQPLFLANPELIFDGELYNHELKEDFNEIISIVRRSKPSAEDLEKSKEMAQYHVYDLPSNDGVFLDRSVKLHNTVKTLEYTKYVTTLIAGSELQADEDYGLFMEQGYEGGMARLNQPYEGKRSKTLMKRKDFEDSEFEIVRIEEGQGNWAGYAKRVVFKLEDGRECGSGLKGNFAFAKQLLEDADLYVGGEATIKFFTRTPDGMPRFPVAIGMYKTARDM